MFIGKIPQGLIRLRNRVNAVVKYSMTIQAMLKDGSFVPTSAQIKRQSKKRSGFARIVENLFPLIHQYKISAVLWNVGRPDQKPLTGRCVKESFGSACNAEKNFGRNLPTLRIQEGAEVEHFALERVKSIFSGTEIRPIHVSTLPENGFGQEKESSKGIAILAKSADFQVNTFISIIRNSNGMVARRRTGTSLRFVCPAI